MALNIRIITLLLKLYCPIQLNIFAESNNIFATGKNLMAVEIIFYFAADGKYSMIIYNFFSFATY